VEAQAVDILDFSKDVPGTPDSPLPVSRAGPVVIPTFYFPSEPIRAESSSPYRPLASPTKISSEASDIKLGQLDSPPRSTPIKPFLQPLVRNSKILKPVPGSVDRQVSKVAERQLAINSQLNVATSRLLGPPSRSISSSSMSSSSSTSSVRPSQLPRRNCGSPKQPKMERRIVPPSPAMSSRSETCYIPQPSRPPLQARTATIVRVPVKSVFNSVKNNQRAPDAVAAIKRPVYGALPAPVPRLVTTGRPTMGLPSRYVRDAPYGVPPSRNFLFRSPKSNLGKRAFGEMVTTPGRMVKVSYQRTR
jgi:hypothetical protein